METELATPEATRWWRRALLALVRAFSSPAESDAFGSWEGDTVFQQRAATVKAAPRPFRRNAES